MAKKSKLPEKGTRMPDIRETELDQAVSEYLAAIQSLNSESARSQRFTLLLNRLFGLQPGFIEDYVAGVEKYVKVRQKDAILRGRADELFGNVVIEFERDLTAAGKQAEAEGQLKKYVACLWSQEPVDRRTRYLCLAADGLLFTVYTPVLDLPNKATVSPEDVRLEVVERIDAARLEPPREFYFWLDRYLLRREILAPRSENIVKDFGLRSHAFQVAAQSLMSLWKRLKGQPEFAVVYEAWEKYLHIVYGSALADDELFVRHTYLATLAKLMAWARLTEGKTLPETQAILEGQFFKEQGIENFLEEDFFSWPARGEAHKTGVELAHLLLGLLRNYNLRELSEDVLKSLYQELVDPKTRHDLGEYYTPDWLAGRMVHRLLQERPRAALLDPACGSGTFLYQAVREKRRVLGDLAETLEHVLDAVVGVDIHPLAVIVAKTNYLLALGDLLRKRRGKIAIPIYLANAIRLPEWEAQPTLWMQLPGYRIELDGQTIYLPEKLLDRPALYDQAIEAAREFAVQWAGRAANEGHFLNYLAAHHPALAADETLARALFAIAEALRHFIETRRDTIWAFVLKNAYKPLFLKGRFDVVIGNPPWLSYRYVEQLDYQRFLKDLVTQTYRLLSGKAELITQMELGTLFLLRAADLYLKEGGSIAFVLPRSIFSADQHDALRQGTFKGVRLDWTELWDLESVEPLFNVPACVLFAAKTSPLPPVSPFPSPARGGEGGLGGWGEVIPGQVLSGSLPRRNAGLPEAEAELKVEDVQFFLNRRGKRSFWGTAEGAESKASYYRGRFYQGATIVPRSFWFVEIAPSPLGFDPNLPPLVTSQRAQEQAKDAYQGIVFKGSVESRFLYATLLSTDLLPFGHLDYRLVVLPIEPAGNGYNLLTADQARRRGYLRLAEWLERVQAEWEKRRGAKAERVDALEWLNYRRKLVTQNPQTIYRVIYPTSATYVCACVAQNRPIEFERGGQTVQAMGFLVDCVTYSLETQDESEAYYLAAILNAPLTDKLIKPAQARGLWGPRHICKKVLDLPIPRFDPVQPEHRRLAELGKACSERVAEWLSAGGPGKTRSIGRLRGMVREMLKEELGEIDEYTKRVLDMGKVTL
ncbi:MAG: Eco57I restriction-modification methylase domain-containing protein [Chloroflexia bacterium]